MLCGRHRSGVFAGIIWLKNGWIRGKIRGKSVRKLSYEGENMAKVDFNGVDNEW